MSLSGSANGNCLLSCQGTGWGRWRNLLWHCIAKHLRGSLNAGDFVYSVWQIKRSFTLISLGKATAYAKFLS